MAKKQIINPLVGFGQRSIGPYANRIGTSTYARHVALGDLPPIAQLHGFGEDSNGQIRGLVKGDGSLTFARATGATVTDWQGVIKICLVDELRFIYARRVENLIVSGTTFVTSSEDLEAGYASNGVINDATSWTSTGSFQVLQAAGSTLEAGDYVLSIFIAKISGNSTEDTLSMVFDVEPNVAVVIHPDSVLRRYALPFTTDGSNTSFTATFQERSTGTGTYTVTKWSLEKVTDQTDQNPGEYVSAGVLSGDYHGVGVDGVADYAYENGNTVDGDSIVIEAKGPALTIPWKALNEPGRVNHADGANDLSGGPEVITLGIGDETLSVDGTAAVTVAAGTATGTGFGQATEGNPVTFNLSVGGTVTLTLDSGTLTKVGGLAVKQVEAGTPATSWIPSDGGTANRTADDGVPSFAYSNWNQTEGTLILDLVMESEADQGIFNVANAEAGVLSYDSVNKFKTDDGTNQASVDPSLGSNLGDTIRFAVDYETGGSLRIGYRNITDAGSFVWDTDGASYSGGFATDSVINMFYNLATVSKVKDLYYYQTQQDKAWVEDNF